MTRVLITGGGGFVGSHFIEHLLRKTDWDIVSIDRIDMTSNLERFKSMSCWHDLGHRVKFVWHDLKAAINESVARSLGNAPFDFIFHLAASSHVDRSITDPMSFVMDNVVGTVNILDYARYGGLSGRFFYFSTDEVFGPAPDGVAYKEWDRYNCGNPYSASKAGGEQLAIAYANTYRIPTVVTNCMNVFGERQHPEKFIPKVIRSVLLGEEVTVHAYPDMKRAGSRYYIHARNVASAVLHLTDHGNTLDGTGTTGKYNIPGEKEVDNLTLAHEIATIIGKPLNYKLVDFHAARPGHDLAYRLDGSLIASTGWKVPVSFGVGLEKTVRWMLNHPEWLGL